MRLFRPVPVIVFCVLLIACGGGGDDNSDNGGTMQFVNVVPDSPTLGMEIDDVSVATAAYAQSSTRLSYIAGEKEVEFYRVLPDGDTEDLDLDIDINLEDDQEVVLILHGSNDDIQLDVYEFPVITDDDDEDDEDDDDEDDTGWVGLFNYSGRQPSVDMYLTDEFTGLFETTPVASVTAPGFDGLYELSVDDYELQFSLPGETDVLYDADEIEIEKNVNNYYMVVDLFGADDSAIVVLEFAGDASAQQLVNDDILSELRFINGVANYPAADFYLGDTAGEPVFENIAFGEATGYIGLEADSYSFNVTPHGVKDQFFFQQTSELAPGDQVTLVASGLYGEDDDVDDDDDIGTSGKLIADSLRSVAEGAELSFVHASLSNEAVDIYLLSPGQPINDDTPVVSSLAYLLSFDYTAESGDYEIVVTQSDNDAVIVGPVPITLLEGDIVDFYLFDSEGGGTPGQLEAYSF